MIMIANLQYAWTLFVKPLMAAHHWKLSDVQWAFSLFIACQTWFMPCSGWLIDKMGPRKFMTIAGALCGIGWASMSGANTLTALYAFYAMAGIGALMVTANINPLSGSYMISATALTVALSMNPIANGASRLFWGWTSDRLGRENSMVIAFLIQSAALLSVPSLAHGSNIAFVI